MRTHILVLWIFLSGATLAQRPANKLPEYAQQQIQITDEDCFYRNYDAGIVAKQRGDCRNALRFFRQARACEGVGRSKRRMSDLNALIDACEKNLQPVAVKADELADFEEQEEGLGRRRHHPSRAFLNDARDSCFEITYNEARLAFSKKCWEDAAALFRAAKNCIDADQLRREQMNRAIAECRNAAELELRGKEEEAKRQTRDAVAANLADDAADLLAQRDRSIAYRLAEFANDYIAPYDNPDCYQAILNARYFTPVPSANPTDAYAQTPFCYFVGNNLSSVKQIKFQKRGHDQFLFAFDTTRRQLLGWNMATFEATEPIDLPEGILFFEPVPDDQTLLFVANNAFVFYRDRKESFRLPVNQTAAYCFSPDGREFYFETPSTQSISAISINDMFSSRKMRAETRPYISGLKTGAKALAIHDKSVWLAYPDEVLILKKSGSGKPWQKTKTLFFNPDTAASFERPAALFYLYPKDRALVIRADDLIYTYSVPDEDGRRQIYPQVKNLITEAVAIAPNDAVIAEAVFVPVLQNYQLQIYRTGFLSNEFISLKEDGGGVAVGKSAFSDDLSWLAYIDYNGALKAWDLAIEKNEGSVIFETQQRNQLGADGNTIWVYRSDTLHIYAVDNPGRPLFSELTFNVLDFPFGSASQWAFYRITDDSIVLRPIYKNGPRFKFLSQVDRDFLTVFDVQPGEESYVVFQATTDSLEVRSLSTGELLAARSFGGAVREIKVVPGSNLVLVKRNVNLATDEGLSSLDDVALWDLAQPFAKLRLFRLPNILANRMAAAFDKAAFSNGNDIRVFNIDDPDNEALKIWGKRNISVTALAFSPDGRKLAAGYSNGSVSVFDAQSGKLQFSISTYSDDIFNSVDAICFVDSTRLRLLTFSGKILTRDISLENMRNSVQTGRKRLIAFSPQQIRDYQLESAFRYPNAFKRLATSGDLPLIQSFFQYFQEEANSSNNIERVRDYCRRALVLYNRLDPSSRQVLRPTLVAMYEQHHWKRLLRGQLPEAGVVISDMKNYFPDDLATLKASAHNALLKDDFQRATGAYMDWALQSWRESENNFYPLYILREEYLQLVNYELAGKKRQDCFCSVFAKFRLFSSICKNIETLLPPYIDRPTALRWNIFKNLGNAEGLNHHAQKTNLLRQAREDALSLANLRGAGADGKMLEETSLSLASAYYEWGKFELDNKNAIKHYQKTVEILGPMSLQGLKDTSRLSLLSAAHLSLGNCYASFESWPDAVREYQSGITVTETLLSRIPDSIQASAYKNQFLGVLYEKMGNACFFKDDYLCAQEYYDKASAALTFGLSRLYYGHLALARGDDVTAEAEYASVISEEQLGLALSGIARIIRRAPMRSRPVNAFADKMAANVLKAKPSWSGEAVSYYKADAQMQFYQGLEKWDSVLYWNNIKLEQAKKLSETASGAYIWKDFRLDAALNRSYYLVVAKWNDKAALDEAVETAESALRYMNTEYAYYSNGDYLLTNYAHALALRNEEGDRAEAVRQYREFLSRESEFGDNYWEVLQKDFRDLKGFGVQWPDLRGLIEAILPESTEMQPEDWAELGL